MERKNLDFGTTIKEAFSFGIKNAPSIMAAFLLWLITIWIPYINIGTTIAMSMLPLEVANGRVINPLDIFDSKWRRYMGEFFMTFILMILPMLIAFLFLYIPGIVLSMAWSLSFYFLIDKGKNPVQAIKASNDATYGSKWTIFFTTLVIGLLLGIIGGAFYAIGLMADSLPILIAVMVVFVLIAAPIGIAADASIWRQLRDNVE
ncbi:MAG: hypothetical protein RRZ83_00280 [Alistipes sp.]